MKYSITMLIVLFTSTLSLKADACSVVPFNKEAFADRNGAQMQATAQTALGILSKDILDTEATTLDGNYIWSNPMCPEGAWLKAQFEFSLKNGCTGQAHVTRQIAEEFTFGGVVTPAKNSFLVEITNPVSCN